MSEARELFADLRRSYVDQGVPVPETWTPEPEPEAPVISWHSGGDAAGGALFEYERADRRSQAARAGGALAMGGTKLPHLG